ncbi:unnamed protein product, partial [Ectocarpus sp. 8 AP-2014]
GSSAGPNDDAWGNDIGLRNVSPAGPYPHAVNKRQNRGIQTQRQRGKHDVQLPFSQNHITAAPSRSNKIQIYLDVQNIWLAATELFRMPASAHHSCTTMNYTPHSRAPYI